MNYYNPKIQKIVTPTVLHGIMGGDLGIDVIRRADWFPVRYDYIDFNPDTHKMLPVAGLMFDKLKQEYVQHFELVPLNAEEIAQREEIRKREAEERSEKQAEEERLPDLEDAVAELGSYVDEAITDNGDAVIDLAGYVASLEEPIAALEGAKE